MILAALLLLAQDASAPASVEEDEGIVVNAVYGRTTMLFDKGPDGKLYNCRIMVSSGSASRDENACQATPVCYAGTADEVTDCVPYVRVAPADITTKPAPPGAVQTFTMPQLVKPPVNPAPTTIGPVQLTGESRETERQRVKLPPLPKAPGDGPAIRVTGGQPNDPNAVGGQITFGKSD